MDEIGALRCPVSFLSAHFYIHFSLSSFDVVIALDFALRPGKTVESEPCIAQLKN